MPIRMWREEDLPEIYNLLDELNKALGEDQEISIETIKSHYNEMQKYNDIYINCVYEIKDKIVGFVSIVNYRSVYHIKGTALINELIVSREYRNRGIGEELLGYCIKEAERNGMDEVEVGVMKENKKAIEFYKRNGIDEEYLLLGKEF